MGNRRRVWSLASALVVASAVVAVACGSFGSSNEDSPPTNPQSDATASPIDGPANGDGGDAGAGNDDGGANDAALDCQLVIDDEFDTLDSTKWDIFSRAGTALPSADAGELQFIEAESVRGGLVVWKTPLVAKRMHVETTLKVGPPGAGAGSGGDAFAVAWMKDWPFNTSNQGTDANMCEDGNEGGLVYVDTTDGAVGVGDISQEDCGSGFVDVPELDNKAPNIVFDVDGAQVSGTFDGSSVSFSGTTTFPLPKPPLTFRFVLSASSGGAYSAHYVQRVKVTVCN